MKTTCIFFSFLLILCVLSAAAQPRQLYGTDTEKFAGTWQYQHGDTTFTLELRVANEHSSSFIGQRVVGAYELVVNGQRSGDSRNAAGGFDLPVLITDAHYQSGRLSFMGLYPCLSPGASTNKLSVSFEDKLYNGGFLVGSFTLLSPTTARFRVGVWEEVRWTVVGQELPPLNAISVPQDAVMTRIALPPRPMPDEPEPPQPDL